MHTELFSKTLIDNAHWFWADFSYSTCPLSPFTIYNFHFSPTLLATTSWPARASTEHTLGKCWSVCSVELITACDWFVVRGDGRMPLDEMNTQRSVMNNKTTAIMSNYTGSHISAPQTHSLWAREARESPVTEEQTWLVEKDATPPPSLFLISSHHPMIDSFHSNGGP